MNPTKNEIKTLLNNLIDAASPTDPDEVMSQSDLTALTDTLASSGLDTVNPNGPCYPSTPR